MNRLNVMKRSTYKPDLRELIKNQTQHGNERMTSRFMEYLKHFTVGEVVDVFECDKHHKNGKELHVITSEGVVFILNARTKKLVTVLFARPAQVKRYYSALNLTAPESIVQAAFIHQISKVNK